MSLGETPSITQLDVGTIMLLGNLMFATVTFILAFLLIQWLH